MSQVPTVPNVPSSIPFTSSPSPPSAGGTHGSSIPLQHRDATSVVQQALNSAAGTVGSMLKGG